MVMITSEKRQVDTTVTAVCLKNIIITTVTTTYLQSLYVRQIGIDDVHVGDGVAISI